MTVESSDVLRVFYIMNGVPTLPFPFPVAQGKDVKVYLKDLTTLQSSELVRDVDFTVALTSPTELPSVGSVEILSDSIYNDSNYKVSILRDTEEKQSYNMEYEQEMNPKELELELDRETMMIQDLTDKMNKDSIKLEVTGEELNNVIKVPTYGMAVIMTPDGIDTVPMELVDGAIQIVNVKIVSDDTLDGDGTIESPLSVGNTLANTLHLNGFDLQDRNSMGFTSFDVGSMTFTLSPVTVNPIKFYANGNQFIFNTAKTCVMSPALETGMYYFYFDNTGVISYIKGEDIFSKVFYEYAICGGIYYNSSYPDEYRLIEERHGYRMSSATHERLHFADGCRYSLGFEPIGWNIGATTYESIGRGFCHDEDIRHDTPLATTHRFMYKIGADKGTWRFTDKNNEAGLKLAGATYYSYNHFDGTNWGLKEGESDTDFWIMFQVFFPSAVDNYNSGEIILMLGQEAYKNASTARNAVETEMSRLKQDGLPSYEMVFLQAYIIKRNGKIVDIDGEGNVFYNIAGVDYGSTNGGGIAPDVQVLPPIAVIDGDTTYPLAGTEFEGFIDATPNHINSNAWEIHTSPTSSIGTITATSEDGAYTVDKTVDAEDATEWHTVAGTYPSGIGSESLTYSFKALTTVNGFMIKSTSTANISFSPKVIDVYGDGVFLETFTYNFTASNQIENRTLATSVEINDLKLVIKEGMSTFDYIMLNEFLPSYDTNTLLKAGTKYTTTKDGVSTLHEITTDTPIPIGDDGDYTVWVDKDRLVTLGESLGLTKKLDEELLEFALPPTGYGTATSSAIYASNGTADNIFDQMEGGALTSDGILLSYASDMWVKNIMSSVKSCNGVYVSNWTDFAPSYSLKDFTIRYTTDGSNPTTSSPILCTGVCPSNGNIFIPFTRRDIGAILITAHNNQDEVASSYIAFARVDLVSNYRTIKFPFYNIAEGNLYEGDDIVEKCPVGQVTVAGGAITSTNSFYHGVIATVPINSGNTITINSMYIQPKPFYSLRQKYSPVMLYAQSKWGMTRIEATNHGVECYANSEELRIITATIDLYTDYIAGEFTSAITTAKALTTIERGY